MAIVAGMILNITVPAALAGADPSFRRIGSLLGGVVMLAAIPFGVVALCGIPKFGKNQLLWKGLVGVLVPMVLLAMAIPAFLKVKQMSTQKWLAEAVTGITREAPKMIDEATRLDKASVIGENEIAVYFTITSFAAKDVDMKKWDSIVVPLVRRGVKDSIFGALLKQGIGVRFRYHGKDGVFFAEVIFDPQDYK